MNFRPELAETVANGSKTVTRRLVSDNPRSPWWREKCSYRVGQDVAICPGRGEHAICRARIVSVQRLPLGRLGSYEARLEGFAGSQEFADAWESINGSCDPDAIVWRIGLERIA